MALPYGYTILPGTPTAPPPPGYTFAPGLDGKWYQFPSTKDNSPLYQYGGVSGGVQQSQTEIYQRLGDYIDQQIQKDNAISLDIPGGLFGDSIGTPKPLGTTQGPVETSFAGNIRALLDILTNIPRMLSIVIGLILLIAGLFMLSNRTIVNTIQALKP